MKLCEQGPNYRNRRTAESIEIVVLHSAAFSIRWDILHTPAVAVRIHCFGEDVVVVVAAGRTVAAVAEADRTVAAEAAADRTVAAVAEADRTVAAVA